MPPPGRLARRRAAPARPRRARRACWAGLGWGLTPRTAAPSRQSYILKPLWRAGRRIQGTRARRRPRGWRDDAGLVRAGRVQITLPPETRRPLQERAQALRPPGDTTTAALRVESSRHIDRVGARSRSRDRVARYNIYTFRVNSAPRASSFRAANILSTTSGRPSRAAQAGHRFGHHCCHPRSRRQSRRAPPFPLQ